MSVVVSVRLADQDEAWLRNHGLKPGPFAAAAVHEAIRRQEVQESQAFLATLRHRTGVDTVGFFRAERENHPRRA